MWTGSSYNAGVLPNPYSRDRGPGPRPWHGWSWRAGVQLPRLHPVRVPQRPWFAVCLFSLSNIENMRHIRLSNPGPFLLLSLAGEVKDESVGRVAVVQRPRKHILNLFINTEQRSAPWVSIRTFSPLSEKWPDGVMIHWVGRDSHSGTPLAVQAEARRRLPSSAEGHRALGVLDERGHSRLSRCSPLCPGREVGSLGGRGRRILSSLCFSCHGNHIG